MTLETLNALEPGAARDALTACCGAPEWVARMLDARPFASAAALLGASNEAWSGLAAGDIHSAVAHHPRIGESAATSAAVAGLRSWSQREQSAALSASDAVRAELREANAGYEHRFGHRFIVCAEGRGADELLAALRARIANDPSTELATTSEELRRITALRLGRLIDEP